MYIKGQRRGTALSRLDRGSAERTGGVSGEPHVNALRVESVVTVGEHAPLFAVRQLRQAHGAVLERAVDGGREVEGGEGLHNGALKAALVERGIRGKRFRREKKAAAAAAEADVGVEQNNDDDENEQENGSAHHNLAVVGILGFIDSPDGACPMSYQISLLA
ncbi:hypothetical protein VNO78_18067 [Psophocarpus tetragonolobus]|uniref:Uncharacterized protein n=1 Tax=Psophocarpus tetragonolobus TaxID=3891 RepID=A0AAN9SIN5_PSOTE